MITQVRKLKLNVTNIKSVLINSNKRLRTLEMKKSAFISTEDKKIKRLRKEEKIEEKKKKSIPIIGGVLGRVTGAVGNIKDRLLNFFGYLLIGFLINKLPQIISWVKTTWTKIKGLWDGLVNVLNIIGNGFKFVFNIIGGLTGIKFVTRGLGNIANKFLNLQKDMDKNPIPKNSNLVEDDRGSINDPTPIEQLEIPEFADGGRPPVGETSIVGEEGAELFVADKPGTIIPNDQLPMGLGGGGGGTDALTEQAKVKTFGDTVKEVNRNWGLIGREGINYRTQEDYEDVYSAKDKIDDALVSLNNNVERKNLNPLASSSKQIAILPITRYIKTPSSNNPSNINIASRYQPAPVSP